MSILKLIRGYGTFPINNRKWAWLVVESEPTALQAGITVAIGKNQEPQMLRGIWVASLSTILSASATAHGFACEPNDDSAVHAIIQNLDRLESLLPLLPKQEDQAMADLGKQALGLDARAAGVGAKAFSELENNPYYYLRRVRIALKRARDAMGIILVDAKSLRNDKYIGMGFPQRFYDDEYADADAVKLDHAGFVFFPLELMEVELRKFLDRDAEALRPLLSENTRGELEGRSYGYVAELGTYVQCKLSNVIANQRQENGSQHANQTK